MPSSYPLSCRYLWVHYKNTAALLFVFLGPLFTLQLCRRMSLGVHLELSDAGTFRVAGVRPDGIYFLAWIIDVCLRSPTEPALRSTGPAGGQAGLRQGDMLLCVAGLSVSGRSMDEVEQMLDDGPPGSTVTMILQREGCGAIVASLIRAAPDDTMQDDLHGPPRDVQGDFISPECRGGLTDGPSCSVDNSRVDDSTSIDSLSDFRTRVEFWCVHAQPCPFDRIYAFVDVR